MKKPKLTVARRVAGAVAACALTAAMGAALVGCSSNAKNTEEMSVAWTSNAGEYNLDPTNNYMGWQGSYLGIYEQLFRIDGNAG